ncbi:MAG TPA: nucleotidyltransferase family protein [Acidimicrobiales bacterium]|nr:nucleotidyltransferase family protein [Acidimicrobiales bacterium]
MTTPGSTAARMLIEHATSSAVAVLRGAGVPSIALRGPVLVRMLYDDADARGSLDVDLLVPDLARGSAALVADGYEIAVDWTPGMEKHAWTHVKENEVSIDLHRILVGIDADVDTVWRIFERESSAVEVLGGRVDVPNAAAQALTVALHAFQHGPATSQTAEDLVRALTRIDASAWRRAAELARELDAEDAFAAGLRQHADGVRLAATLGLAQVSSRRTAIRAAHGSAEPAVLGLDALLTLRGARRVAFAAGKLLPPHGFMHERYPWSRRGRVALGLSYLYRAGWIAWHLPGGLTRLRAAGRRSR